MGGSETLIWPSLAASAGAGTVYDVAKGSLAGLAAAGTSASVALACDLPATTIDDASIPAPWDGFYYLVRARNVCGTGSWGKNSNEVERVSLTCP